jgi:predicted nucleotidyltransferase
LNDRQNILKEIKQSVISIDENAEVILFGSRARGDYHDESDWDVLVLVDEYNWKLKNRFIDKLFEVQIKEDIGISVMVKGKEYWNMIEETLLYKEVEKHGLVL